ncbi:sodium:proton exchanger [Kineosporia sp. R_H_3]|uniref:sodium:proton exchanger n=1 Tax=Kineosporia sp. R_H_3 TaxID=1961848 RepID=UPI000B4BA388|nr:sodium:proton exchanger [Kineosporia sp. R_H_3]
MTLALGVLLLAGAAVALVVGAELFVENVARAARRLGLTIVAVGILLAGAEPEEALTGVLASAAGRPGLAAGDAIGANVTMLTAALGLAALARPLPVGRRVREYAAGAAVAGLLAVAVLADGVVGRVEGGLLLLAYVALVALVWWREREPPAIGELAEVDDDDDDDDDDEGHDGDHAGRRADVRGLLLALVGLLVMTGGGALAVAGAERVVAGLGVTDDAVGLTALALATTAELFALVAAGVRRDLPEVAVAGVVGSVAYNATVSLGLAAVVRPLAVERVLGPALLAVVLAVALPLLARGGRLGRPAGAVLAAGYVGFVVLTLA